MLRRLTDPVGRSILYLLVDTDAEADAKRRLNNPKDDVDEVTELFLEYLATRTKSYLAAIGVLLLLLFTSDLVACGQVPGQAYGLLLDICGAVVLGRGLLKGPYRMAAEAAAYLSKSVPRQRAVTQDLADGLWGVFLLIFGVLVQFAAVFGLLPIVSRGCLL